MTNEPTTTALSPRAGIAMLTLQLRAALQEADALERTDHTIDEAAARRQLRERLDPLMDDRRRAFAAELDAARARSAAAIQDARDEADRRARAAAALAVAAPEPTPDPFVLPEAVVLEAVEPEVVVPEPVEPEVALEEVEPEVVVPAVVEPAVVAAPVGMALARPEVQEIKVSIDADAFARVFATVFASIIEQRGMQQPYLGQQYPQPTYAPQSMYLPVNTPEPPRQSFWSHARHPDVLLMGLATVIVLVVLAAWLV